MWPGRVSNPGPLTYESGAPPTAPRGPALSVGKMRLHLMRIIYQRYGNDKKNEETKSEGLADCL